MSQSVLKQDSENPFRLSATGRFVFASAAHEQCFDGLLNGVRQRRPLQIVTGEPGTGKTALLHRLGSSMGDDARVVFCFSSALDSGQLLDFLATNLAGPGKTADEHLDLETFSQLAQSECKPGQPLLILIDDAQHLEPSALDLVFGFADQSARDRASFVVTLAGSDELEQDVQMAAARHHSEADYGVYRLQSLTEDDTRRFVAEQLTQAGLSEGLFSDTALERVIALTSGVPRTINSLCGLALLHAQLSGDLEVTEAHVDKARKDLSIEYGEQAPGTEPDELLAAFANPQKYQVVVDKDAEALATTQGSLQDGMASGPQQLNGQTLSTEEARPEVETKAGPVDLATETPVSTEASTVGVSGEAESEGGVQGSVPSEPLPPDSEPVDTPSPPAIDEFYSHESASRVAERPDPRSTFSLKRIQTRWMALAATMAIVVVAGIGYVVSKGDLLERQAQVLMPPGPATDAGGEAGDSNAAPQTAAQIAISEDPPAPNMEPVAIEFRTPKPASDIPLVAMSPELVEPQRTDGSGDPRDQTGAPVETSRVEEESNTTKSESEGLQPTDDNDSGDTLDQETTEANDATNREEQIKRRATDLSQQAREMVGLQAFEATSEKLAAGSKTATPEPALLSEVDANKNEATVLQAAGDSSTALAKAGLALTLESEDSALLNLQQEVQPKQAAEMERQRIAREAADLGDQARAALATSEFDTAQQQVAAALALTPDDTALLALQGEIDTAHEAELEQRRITAEVNALRNEATALQAAGDSASALEKIGSALALAPEDSALLALQQEIKAEQAAELERQRIAQEAADLGDQARAALSASEFDTARQQVAAALALNPDDTALLALQGEIDTAHEAELERRRIAAEVNALRNEATVLQAAGDSASALEKIGSALALAPEDSALLALQQEIKAEQAAELERQRIAREAADLGDQARAALSASEFDTARQQVAAALALTPDDTALLALQGEIDTAHEAELEQRRITAEVNALRNEATVLQAAGDSTSALEKIGSALALAPEDSALLALQQEIKAEQAAEMERQRIAREAADLGDQARAALSASEFDTARQQVAAALALTPDDTALLALQGEIDTAHEAELEQRRITAEVNALRNEATALQAAGDSTNALEKIGSALALAPEDSALLALQQEIQAEQAAEMERQRIAREAADLGDQARAALAASEFDTAQQQVAAALALTPDDTALLALQGEIDTAHEAELEQRRITAEVNALRNEATVLQAAGDSASALEKVGSALALAPEDSALLALQQEIQAEQAAELERQRVAKEIDGLSDRARAALATQDFDAARIAVTEALGLAPDNAGLRTLGKQIDSERLAALEQARIAADAERLTTLSRDQLTQGEMGEALTSVEKALSLAPDNPDALALQRDIQTQQKAELERQRIAKEVDALSDRAREALATQDFDAARIAVTEALGLAPDNAGLRTLGKQIDSERLAALEQARVAAEVELLATLSRDQLSQGELDAATMTVNEALKLAPDNPNLGQIQGEIEALQKAELARAQLDQEIIRLKAEVRLAMKDQRYGAANTKIAIAIGMAPNNQELLALGREVEIEQEAALKRTRLSDETQRLVAMARLALAAGDYEAAQNNAIAALALNPENQQVTRLTTDITSQRVGNEVLRLVSAARTQQNAGDFLSALAIIDEAQALDPTNRDLASLRAQLETQQQAAMREAQERSKTDISLDPTITAMAAALMKSGDDQMRRRDPATARLYYEGAFEAGALQAAVLVGNTYDPLILKQLGVVGFKGDVEQALYWYAIGRDAGDQEALERMELLRIR